MSPMRILLMVILIALASAAQADSCRDWSEEHARWKGEAVRQYLQGAPQQELDSALFEMLQREAYLTSCDLPFEVARNRLVGWRMVGLGTDDYIHAVLESVLAQTGFELDLEYAFADRIGPGPAVAAGPHELVH